MLQAEDALFALFAVKLDLVSEANVEKALSRRDEGQLVRDALIAAGKLTVPQAQHVMSVMDPLVIAGYRIEGEAGRGGMGVVYRARQLSMDRLVALKVLTRRLSRDEAYVAKFLEEARSAAKLNHENIVAAIDAGESNGLHYFAMEFVAGSSVADALDQRTKLTPNESFEIAEQIARALEHAHQAGLVHRDVKPENILIGEDGQAKLCDLGLAKPSQEAGTGEKSAMTEGTPYYCSPEQALGRTDIDPRSDVYSLGITIFHMIRGEPPVDGDSPRAILLKQVKQPFPDLATALPEVSEPLRALIGRMVVKGREERLGSMREFAEGLTLARDEAADAAAGPRHAPGSQRGAPLAPILGAVALLLVIVVALAIGSGDPGKEGETPSKTVVQVPSTTPSKTGEGPVRVSPTPDPSSGGDTDRLRKAKAAYDAALAFEEQNPKDTAGQRERFAQVADSYPGTGYAAQAEVRLARLGQSAKRGVTRALDALSEQVMARLSRNDVKGALELIDTFQTAWAPKKIPGLKNKIDVVAGRVRRQASLKLHQRLVALETGKGDARVRAEVEGLLPLVPSGLAASARQRLKAVDRAKSRQRLSAIEGAVDAALNRGDIDAARAALDAGLADKSLAGFAGTLRLIREDIDSLAAARLVFDARLDKLPREAHLSLLLRSGAKLEGRFLDFAGLLGRFQGEAREPRLLHLREIAPGLVAGWGLPPSKGRGNVLLFLRRGLPEVANAAYQAYLRAGGKRDPRLSARIDVARASIAARAASDTLGKLLEPGLSPDEVVKGIRGLAPPVHRTKAYRELYPKLQAAFAAARLSQIQTSEEALFHAAEIKKDRRGRLTLVYNFKHADQLLDWTPDKKAHPAAKREITQGGALFSGVVHLEARFLAGLLKVDFKVSERNRRRPNLNVILTPGQAVWEGVLCGAGFAYGDLVNLKIDTDAKKRAGYIVDLPAHVLVEFGGKEPERRMPGVMAAATKPNLAKGKSIKVSLSRSTKGQIKFKIGSRMVYSATVASANLPGRVTLAPFSSEFTLTSITVYGRLDPEWVKGRAKQVADAEAAGLPAPR
jgi:hypothetical protein